MPVIPEPHDHLQAALDAIDEHQAHHEARITFHQNEVKALYALRLRYRDILGQVAPEPEPVVTAINIIGAVGNGPIDPQSGLHESYDALGPYKAFTGEP